MIRTFLAVLALVLLSALPAASAPVNAGHVTLELVAQDSWATPGGTAYVAVRQTISPGWHTYWRNPGDSGEATQIAWTLPAGWRAGDIVWAPPRRLPVGPLMNYGYEGKVLLAVPIEVPVSAAAGGVVTLRAHVSYLVCKDICIPEDGEVSLDLPVRAGAPSPDPTNGAAVASALMAAPKAAGLTGAFVRQDGTLKLAVTGAPLAGADVAGAYFYPFVGGLVSAPAPQVIGRGPEGLTLVLAIGDTVKASGAPAELSGVLEVGGATYEVTAKPGPIPPGAEGLPPPRAVSAAAAADLGLPLALVFAFLGGLILNLMPCVFPVLSMKAAALAGHAHEPRFARRQGAAFLVGVVITFLGLAGALIAAKAAGEAVGWGFQLQSPQVVAPLSLLMLGVALNLSGVFEIGLSVQGAGSALVSRGGLAGSFFTGVLAVVVAAPCTAPFMAGALGYALTQPPQASLAVFLSLALGFAAPFTALAFAPALLRRLPKPGAWMDLLRHGLAFPMYGTAAWLGWVLSIQAGSIGLARLLAVAVALAFGLWLFGVAQRTGQRRLWQGLGGAVALGALAAAIWPAYAPATQTTTAASPGDGVGEAAEIPSVPYSPERLAALRAEGTPVFVNFTAAWCVTCQVNEKVALSRAGVAAAFKATGAVYMVGDWTNRDAVIAAALSDHGRAGVPLYLVYDAKGGEPVVLPQLLTEGAVVAALRAAAGSSRP